VPMLPQQFPERCHPRTKGTGDVSSFAGIVAEIEETCRTRAGEDRFVVSVDHRFRQSPGEDRLPRPRKAKVLTRQALNVQTGDGEEGRRQVH